MYICRMKNFELQIIKRVMDIFVSYGIRSISMDFIALHIPLNKKDLLKIAKNKEELVGKIFSYRMNVAQAISQYILEQKQVKNAIDVLLYMSAYMAKATNEFNPQLDFELKKYYPQLFATYESERNERILNNVSKILERGKSEGVFLQDLDIDAIIDSFCEHASQDYEITPQNEFTPETLQQMEEAFYKFIYSISTQEWLSYIDTTKNHLSSLVIQIDEILKNYEN